MLKNFDETMNVYLNFMSFISIKIAFILFDFLI